VYNIFSTPIFIDDIDLSKVNLLSESFKTQWESNTLSSHGEPNTLKHEEVNYLLNLIVKNLNEFISDKFEIKLNDMWRNKYKLGDFQDKHVHIKHDFSFIIYEEVKESKTVFVHPIQQLLLEKYGYDKDDKVTDGENEYDILVDNDGHIVNVIPPDNTLTTKKDIEDLPLLQVTSSTGYGAILKPSLKAKPTYQGEVKQVIDCIS